VEAQKQVGWSDDKNAHIGLQSLSTTARYQGAIPLRANPGRRDGKKSIAETADSGRRDG